MAHPTAGFGHNPADKEAGWGNFTVTPSVVSGAMKFIVTDSAHLLTSVKMARAVILDAIDQWIVDDAAQIATNNITIGNAPPADFGGSNPNRPPGDGGYLLEWVFQWALGVSPYAMTPAVTTGSLSTSALTVEIPYADVV